MAVNARSVLAFCVVVLTPGVWAQAIFESELTGADFGFLSAIAIDDNIAVVGESVRDNFTGEVRIFDVTTGQQLAQLLPDKAGTSFGVDVAISDGTVIVGTIDDGAYPFDATTGSPKGRLNPSDADVGERFGLSVDISGGVAIVSNYQDDEKGEDAGAAFLFDINSGEQIAKLTADNATESQQFGRRVSLSDKVAVVGGSNAPFPFYVYDVETGDQLLRLEDDVLRVSPREAEPIAVSGTTAIIGNPFQVFPFSLSEAQLFDLDVSSPNFGQQVARLTAGEITDGFGFAVDIDGNIAVVLAPSTVIDDDTIGSAFWYDVTTGERLGEILPPAGERFGTSIAIDGDKVLVTGTNDRVVYVYTIPEPAVAAYLGALAVLVLRRRRVTRPASGRDSVTGRSLARRL